MGYAEMKLGKRPKRHDARTLRLSRYLKAADEPAGAQPPAAVDYTHGIADWGVMLNDELGCCTIAAIGHAVQAWTVNALGRELTVPDSTILEYYEEWDGYNPVDPSSDQGGVELDVLNAWRKSKFAGHGLDAYVAIALSDSAATGAGANAIPQIATAIWLFGGAYIGIELPITAQKQDIWDVPANLGPDDEPGSWGGHAVYLVGYDMRDSGLGVRGSGAEAAAPEFTIQDSRFNIQDQSAKTGAVAPIQDSKFKIQDQSANPDSLIPKPESRTLTCITWGKPKKMTLAWFEKYCSEAYALVSTDWLQSNGLAPSGFDLDALEKDLQAVTVARCRMSVA